MKHRERMPIALVPIALANSFEIAIELFMNSAALLTTCTEEGEYQLDVEVAAASVPKATYIELLRVALGPASCWDIRREIRAARRIGDARSPEPEPAVRRPSATREELQELILDELGNGMGQIFVDDLMGRKLSAEETLGDKVLLYKTLDAYVTRACTCTLTRARPRARDTHTGIVRRSSWRSDIIFCMGASPADCHLPYSCLLGRFHPTAQSNP
jgi:hypothetical protein